MPNFDPEYLTVKQLNKVDFEGIKKGIASIERETNDRVFNNRDGMRKLLEEYGKMVWFEDDNIVSPLFLDYINEGLDFFKNDNRIFVVGGYNTPVKYKTNYKYDFYLSRYFPSYGFGTWCDRKFIDALMNNDAFLEVQADNELKIKIDKSHPHLINALKEIYEGNLDAGDFKAAFYMRKNDLFAVRPIYSFVNNIGFDGSGLHCGTTNRFNVDLNKTRPVDFIENLSYNEELDKEGYQYT